MRILEIAVQPDIASIISYYQQIKVYKAPTYDGSFVLVEDPIPLVPNQSLYPFVDSSGLLTDVYRFSYYRTLAAIAESDRYDLPVYYFTVEALKARISDGIASNEDDRNFIDACAAATDAVNRYCGRRFNQVIQTRYFEGSFSRDFFSPKGTQFLNTDDFVSVSAVAVTYPTGATTLDHVTDIYPLPENAPRIDWPYDRLAIVPQAGKDYWPTEYRSIAVTGVWGWPINAITQSTVPAAVKEATMEIALRLYKGKDNAYARVMGNGDLGTFRVSDDLMNGDTKKLLEPYVRKC